MINGSIALLWIVLLLTIATMFVLIYVWLPNHNSTNSSSDSYSESSLTSSSSASFTGLTGLGFDAATIAGIQAFAANSAVAVGPTGPNGPAFPTIGFVGESVGQVAGNSGIDRILVPASQVLAGGTVYDIQTGEVTAPMTGFYQVSASVVSDNGYSAADLPNIAVGYRINQTGPNNGFYRVPVGQLTGSSSRYGAAFGTVVFLNENDKIGFVISNGAAVLMTYAEAHFAVVRLP